MSQALTYNVCWTDWLGVPGCACVAPPWLIDLMWTLEQSVCLFFIDCCSLEWAGDYSILCAREETAVHWVILSVGPHGPHIQLQCAWGGACLFIYIYICLFECFTWSLRGFAGMGWILVLILCLYVQHYLGLFIVRGATQEVCSNP